jgi:hypothetical protein
MIVYREDEETADPVECIAKLIRRAAAIGDGATEHDEIVSVLIDLGMLEAAVADAIFPEVDGECATTLALREASLTSARLLRHSCNGEPELARREARELAAQLSQPMALPVEVHPRVPEGYAYYALYPETYLQAARQFTRTSSAGRAVCIGLRSIGTSLSACVAAELEAQGWSVESITLRPRGHPFDRRPVLERELTNKLRMLRHADFLVVDEGPGLSGSSFAGTSSLLSDLGVPGDQICLFPSSLADPDGLVSAKAREVWVRHRKAHVSFEEGWLPHAHFGSDHVDVSGGAWRNVLGLAEPDWPAVDPRHERRKYIVRRNDGQRVLHKFAGLGRYGANAYRRSCALAEAGFIPAVMGLRQGFLQQELVRGRPLARGETADRELIQTAQRYFAYLVREFPLPKPVRLEPLLAMMRVNIEEALGDRASGMVAQLERQARGFGAVPAVAVDGRVLPHEWLRTEQGYLKTDAADHHCDHFYPGASDIAWDIAGFGVELELPAAAVAELAVSVGGRFLAERLPFYRSAYLAFRLGYTSFSAQSLAGSADGERMRREAEGYRAKLRASLGEV